MEHSRLVQSLETEQWSPLGIAAVMAEHVLGVAEGRTPNATTNTSPGDGAGWWKATLAEIPLRTHQLKEDREL